MRTRSQTRNRNRQQQQQQVPPTFVEPFDLEEPINQNPPDPPVVTMADNRTIAELLQASTEGYEDAIVVPVITADNFELKHGLINHVQNKQFFGHDKEDSWLKRISHKRTKNKAKNDKTEHGMEKCEKTKSIKPKSQQKSQTVKVKVNPDKVRVNSEKLKQKI
ncbi:hypothetical protein Tco_0502771 [Tanacetum coccineum]